MLTKASNYGLISFKTLKTYYLSEGFHVDDDTFEINYSLVNADGKYNKNAELLSDSNRLSLIFVKFNGNDKDAVSERVNFGNKSIIFAFDQLKNRIASENRCITDTTVRPRVDKYLFDYDCVLEAITNAIVHNDWFISEPLVSMFIDRIEVLSFGGLPLRQTKENFLNGISLPRNPSLFAIFQDLGITEHSGHGTREIVKKYGKDVFEFDEAYIKVTIPYNKEVAKC